MINKEICPLIIERDDVPDSLHGVAIALAARLNALMGRAQAAHPADCAAKAARMCRAYAQLAHGAARKDLH